MNGIDLKIIESIRKDDNDRVLAYLYDKPLKKIRQHIIKNNGSVEEANDIFQDTVMVLYYQVKQDKYNSNHDLDGFLFTIAKNLWINKVKRDKRVQYTDTIVDDAHSDFNDHLKELIVKERSAAMRRVFDKLDEKCRKILQFTIYDKLSMKEISVKMGYSNENVAKSNHYRCKQYLSKLVQEDGELLNLLKH